MKKLLFSMIALTVAAQAHAACPAGTKAEQGQIDNKPICTIQGVYLDAALSLTAQNAYVLRGDVRVGGDNVNPSTVTIEPGTVIYGADTNSYMLIRRGSKIFANGTAAKPIVFTTINRQSPAPNQWGGLVINGNAPITNAKARDQFVKPRRKAFKIQLKITVEAILVITLVA